jgi:hypothetical protein
LLHLSQQDREDPAEVLEEFFCDTNLAEVRALFDNILETCMATDDGPFSKGAERGNLFAIIKKIERVLEANFFIYGFRSCAVA